LALDASPLLMDAYPTALKLTDDRHLVIDWSDGQQRRYGLKALRDACPCATCREKRSAPPPDPLALPMLGTAQLQPLSITGMKPVGNYAYTIAFSDGHDTGIYAFDLLRELGEKVAT
jgi:DUF971 family protein